GGSLFLARAERAQLGHAGHFGRETDAPRAMDAAVHDRLHQRADVLVLDGSLVLVVAAGIDTLGPRLVLQVAFAALIADRATERMVDQQEFHHAFAGLAHHRRLGVDDRRLAGRPPPAVAHAPRRARHGTRARL